MRYLSCGLLVGASFIALNASSSVGEASGVEFRKEKEIDGVTYVFEKVIQKDGTLKEVIKFKNGDVLLGYLLF